MTSNLDRFDAVWTWHRVTTHALDLFETEVRDHPEKHLNALATQSQQDVVSTAQTLLEETVRQLQACSSKSAQALV